MLRRFTTNGRVIEYESPIRSDFSQSFTRPLIPSDWSRFSVYANRVQTITYKERVSQVEHTVLTHLATYRTSLFILPRVKRLSLRVDSSDCLLNTIVFLSPTVAAIFIHIDHEVSDQAIQTFFKTVEFYGSKNLQIFSFSHRRSGPFVMPLCATIESLVQHSRTLTSVTLVLSATNSIIFHHFASLPSLQFFKINASRHSMLDSSTITMNSETFSRFGFDCTPFPSLKTLELAARIGTCSALISAVSSCQLSQLRLQVLSVTNQSLTRCLQASSSHSTTLRSFIIEVLDKDKGDNMGSSAKNEFLFEYLFPCRSLQVLSIVYPYHLKLSGETLAQMANSWPDMLYLSLNPTPSTYFEEPSGFGSQISLTPSIPSPESYSVSISALIPMLRQCRNIRHLGLILDTSTFPKLPIDEAPCYSLKTLDPGYSKIGEDIGPIATFIQKLFPGASLGHDDAITPRRVFLGRQYTKLSERFAILSSTTQVLTSRNRWKSVDTLLKAVASIRTQDQEEIARLMGIISTLKQKFRDTDTMDDNLE